MNLQNDKLRIRDLCAEDEAAYCAILSDPRVSGSLRGSVRPGGTPRLLSGLTKEELSEKFQNARVLQIAGKSCCFAVEEIRSGRFIGLIGSYDIDRERLGLTYWIAAGYQGRGIGTVLLELYCRPALRRFGRRYLIANIARDNPASAAAIRKAGFLPSRFSDDPGFGLTEQRQLFELARG